MKTIKLFEFRKITGYLLLAGAGIFAALYYSKECTRGIEKGIGFCISVLVPSLYLMMAVTAFLIKSGAAYLLCAHMGGVANVLFRLPKESLSAILLALLGGYPIGARCCAMLYEEGRLSESEAAKTAYIAVAAGPGFLVNYIGAALLNCQTAGYILLAAQAVGMLLTGLIVGLTVHTTPLKSRTHSRTRGADLLTESVHSAAYATFSMCAMVLIFSAITEILDRLLPDGSIADILSAAAEITVGCNRLCGRYPLYLAAFFIGFGGLSVHCQIFAALQKIRVSKLLFFLFRIIEGIITAVTAYTLLMIFPMETAVFNSTTAPLTVAKSATLAGSAALALSSLLFITSIAQKSFRR